MKQLGEIFKSSIAYLESKGVSRPRYSVERILTTLLNLTKLDLYTQFDMPLSEKEIDFLRTSIMRRGSGEPIEYILNRINFLGCIIEVNQNVLIPRVETELLVERALDKMNTPGVCFDICCGSGCLGISLKKKKPSLRVIMSDISEKALAIAKRNCELNEVQIDILQGDLLNPYNERADYVICNPPYISLDEYNRLDKEVKDFEPKGALLGGPTGLEFFIKLEKDLPNFLNPGAKLFFEIGFAQADDVLKIFSNDFWHNKTIEKDLAGLYRFFFLEFE